MRVFDAINSGDLSRLPECVTDDFVDHGSPFPLPPGPEGDRLAEHWGVRDEMGALVRMGVLPAPTPVPEAPGVA